MVTVFLCVESGDDYRTQYWIAVTLLLLRVGLPLIPRKINTPLGIHTARRVDKHILPGVVLGGHIAHRHGRPDWPLPFIRIAGGLSRECERQSAPGRSCGLLQYINLSPFLY